MTRTPDGDGTPPARSPSPSPPAGDFRADPSRAHDDSPADRFGTLFRDGRHFRGDCRLVITAVRRGWVRPEDRAALCARFEAMAAPVLSDPASARARYTIAVVRVVLAMDAANLALIDAAIRKLSPPRRGRPRKRKA